MSPNQTNKKTTTASGDKKSTSQSSASLIAGAVLVAASVLPATLNPSTNKSTPAVSTSVSEPAARRSVRRNTSSLAFEPQCRLPFEAIETDGLTIDATCSPDGNAGNDVGKRLESNAKNDFCVGGNPAPITYEDFTNLETAADNISGLRNLLKTSRSRLADLVTESGGTKLGEGRLVQFVGFLFDAHYSNVGSGELVNCKLPNQDENDIHIQLMKDGVEKDPCNSVTAEMSPHFRPQAWLQLVKLQIDRPIRVTGPLFFDDSHQPCHDNVRVSPNRISVWEIHPVYQFEVCTVNEKSVSKCDVKNNSMWIPLDKWNSTDDQEEQ